MGGYGGIITVKTYNRTAVQGGELDAWVERIGRLGLDVYKNLPANAGDTSLIPGLGISPGVGNGNPLQDSCLGNLMERAAWWATVHGVAKSWTRLSTHACLKQITMRTYCISSGNSTQCSA